MSFVKLRSSPISVFAAMIFLGADSGALAQADPSLVRANVEPVENADRTLYLELVRPEPNYVRAELVQREKALNGHYQEDLSNNRRRLLFSPKPNFTPPEALGISMELLNSDPNQMRTTGAFLEVQTRVRQRMDHTKTWSVPRRNREPNTKVIEVYEAWEWEPEQEVVAGLKCRVDVRQINSSRDRSMERLSVFYGQTDSEGLIRIPLLLWLVDWAKSRNRRDVELTVSSSSPEAQIVFRFEREFLETLSVRYGITLDE